ncbi:hypothetical protein C8R43DRAFT_934298 [Mycena crocata]|nr:hypothetical protein C8R43DRAFT_934298 [Mycena crocata]
MEKITSITAALDAGKLPSTAQINEAIVWFKQSAIPAQPRRLDDENMLSEQGRVLADDMRNVLDSYKDLNTNKNMDNLLQETIWHLTEGDINSAVDSPNANKEEVSSDIDAVRKSLRTILSLIGQSLFSEGNFLLDDFASFTRLGLADAAELIQDQAGDAKERLRNVEQEVEEGKRDGLGRDKARLEEETDKRIAFEHRMDTLKNAGSTAIGTHDSGKAKAQDIANQTTERFEGIHYNIYYRACERAQKDPEYHSAVSAVLDTVEKWVFKALDTPSDEPFQLDTFISDSTPEQHVPKALDALRSLLDRFANPQSSVKAVVQAVERFITAVRKNSPEFKTWADKCFTHARRILDDSEYAKSDEARAVQDDLRAQGHQLLDETNDAGRTWAELKDTARGFGGALLADPDIERVRATHAQLGRDAARGFTEAGKETALELAPWFWRDLFVAYASRVLAIFKEIPIPRTEYVDGDIELVLENLDISSLKINPAHITLTNTTKVDVRTSETAEPTDTNVGTRTQIQLQAVQVALKDVSFYYKDKHGSLPGSPAFTGILQLTMPPQGLDVDLEVRLIESEKEREAVHGYHHIDVRKVQFANDVQVGVRENNHAVTLALLKPIFKKGLRQALGRALGAQLRAVLLSADRVAWDVGRRAQVFADTGAGRGAALAAATWSEVGKLIRERDVWVRATGTGVIIVRDEEGDGQSRLAMGAEPQVLPGSKHGPLGTGAESLEARVGTKGDAHSVAREGKEQVSAFRRSVQEKAAAEKKTNGWQSSAFDV